MNSVSTYYSVFFLLLAGLIVNPLYPIPLGSVSLP